MSASGTSSRSHKARKLPGLILRWQKQNDPELAPPSRRGFGSQLIERALAGELQGKVQITYNPAKVVGEIDTPLSAERGESPST